MILTRLYDTRLAQASFLIGCGRSGQAVVIDPNRHLDQYLAAAAEAGLRIVGVTETHIHADFVSGARELASRTGATLYLSDEGGPAWRYQYADAAGATLLRDGASITVGAVRLDVRHTPGHTPEHISFLVTDTAQAGGPIGVVTGDFVFAGDVGRPDLLERAVGVANAADGAARTLFRSMAWFRGLPEHLQVWPGHGAGSACGKGLSAMPQSTVGYETRYNWAFAITNEDAFVSAVLAGQPDPPRYFREMKRINRDGPSPLPSDLAPPRLPAADLQTVLKRGEMVVDIRPAESYAAGHVPGTVNIPRNRSFTTWAGWLLPYDAPFHLLGDQEAVREAARELALIGLDRVGGSFGPEDLDAWVGSGGTLQRSRRVQAEELRTAQRDGVVLLDVRNQDEWDAGHLPGARLVPLGRLPERLNEIPRRQPIVVHCQGGGRCAIAASLLQAAGFADVAEFGPGFSGWLAAGLPVERPG